VSDAYRATPKKPTLVLAARARAHTPLLALGLVVGTFATVFASRAALTISCKHEVAHKERTSCWVEQADSWSRTNTEHVLVDTRTARLDHRGGVTHLMAETRDGAVSLFTSRQDDDALAPLLDVVQAVAVQRSWDYDFRSTKGRVFDLHLVLPGLAFAALAFTIAFRRHRVVLDREHHQLSMTTFAGLLPWRTRRVSLARAARAAVERHEGRARLLLFRDAVEPEVVLDEEGLAPDLDELAQKITAACDAAV